MQSQELIDYCVIGGSFVAVLILIVVLVILI